MDEKSSQAALLFMPDISGFTQFVNETEISHSQHIIEELLETLIDANQLDMKISEIEGDAIFFYRTGTMPDAEKLAEQCKNMFIAFHQQLRKYDLSRICDCGACSTASRLTLKMVAHIGNVSFSKIKEHTKLFGPDVILIHRLLKNDVTEHEYMMVTDSIPIQNAATKKEHTWIQLNNGSSTYDLGEVKYSYSPFKSLYEFITDPPKQELKIYRVKNPMYFSMDINAPMSFVYTQLIDVKNRAEVLPGVLGVKVEDEKHNKMNKLGMVHNCIREPDQGPAVTSAVSLSENKMIFTETSLKQPGSFDYIVEKTGDETCRITFAVHIQLSLPMKIMFNLMMKKKFANNMNLSCQKIKEYNEKKYRQQKSLHSPSTIGQA